MTKAVDLAKTGSLVNSSGQIDLTTGVTGVLPVANGGTGSSGGVSPGGSDRQVQFNNAGAFGGNSGFVYDSSGNLGLGVTPSAWTISPALQVSRASLYGSSSQTILASNWYYGSGDKYIGNGYASLYQQVNGQHQWQTAASGTAGNAITFTQAMTLDASGRLGVGTTSPGSLIHAAGANGTNCYLQVAQTGIESWQIGMASSSSALAFANSGTERMRIDSSGSVGIGTTSPGVKLDVQGSSDTVIRVKGTSGTAGGIFKADGYGSGSYPGFQLAQSGTTYWSMQQRGDTNLHLYRESGSGNVVIDSGSIMNGSGRPMLNQTGGVLQVVSTTKTDTFSTSSGTFTQVTGLTVSITPSSTSSKILVMFSGMGSSNNGENISLQLQRNSTPIFIGDAAGSRSQCFFGANGYNGAGGFPMNAIYLDSPATTSSTTYSIYMRTSNTVYLNRTVTDEDSANRGRTASSITVMEIAG